MTDRFAVLGQPIAQSLSPQIHAGFAAQFGVRMTYEKIEGAPGQRAEPLARLHLEGFRGLNVTAPHTLDVLAAATGLHRLRCKRVACACG